MTKSDMGAGKKLFTRREFLVGSGAVLAIATLLGCSSKITPAKSGTSSSTIPSANGTSTLTPKYGGTLKLIRDSLPGAGGWPSSQWSPLNAAAQLCLEGLLRVDNKGNITNWLAESYKLADDQTSITFTLRKNIKFHDGTEFNGEVAKWNLENALAAKSVKYWNSVDMVDDYTIRVNLTSWSNLVWTNFSEDAYSWMVSPTAFKKYGIDYMKQHPIGTGPFIFESCSPEVNYKVNRNPNYWKKDAQGNQLPYLDAIELIAIVEPMTQIAAMKTGMADAIEGGIMGKQSTDLKALGLKEKAMIGATNCFFPDSANADSPFSKKEVREAVEYSIDKKAFASAFSYGYWQEMYQLPGTDCAAYNPNLTLGRNYDVEKAKQLLDQAGYMGSPRFKTTILPMGSGEKNQVESLQNFLSQVGIQAEINYSDGILAWMDKQNSIHSILTLGAFPDNPANFNASLDFQIGPGSMTNKNLERTDEFVNLLKTSMASVMTNNRLIQNVCDYLVQEALVIPISGSGRCVVFQPYVMNAGWYERSSGTSWNPEQAWLNK